METNLREERGRQIAKSSKICRIGRRWSVPSQTSPAQGYLVDIEEGVCTCPDHKLYGARTGVRCKHVEAVYWYVALGRDVDGDGNVTETLTIKRKTYAPKEGWTLYNDAATQEAAYVPLLLKDLCAGLQDPPRKPGAGRNPTPYRDSVFAAVMYAISQKSTRWLVPVFDDFASDGMIGHASHFNAVGKFLRRETVTPLLVSLIEESAAPMRSIENGQYAIDSTGFSTVTHDRWFDQKHGKLRAAHPWVKLHMMCGTVTHAITGVKVSPEGDCPTLPELLAQTMKHHDVKELSADKAYSSVKNHEVLEKFGIEAFIPFKENAQINPKSEAWSRKLMEFYLQPERFAEHYHRRSLSETVFSMLKQKLGAALASKHPTAMVNEVLARCLGHNLICLVKAIVVAGLAPKFWTEPPAPVLALVKSEEP